MLRMMQGLVRPPVLKRAALLGAILVCCLTCAGCMGQNGGDSAPSEIKGDESLMSQKGHGTCRQAVMRPLRWGANWGKADEVCCFNRHYAESAGSWQSTSFPAALATAGAANQEITFYDSVSGKPLFRAPRGRSAGFSARARATAGPRSETRKSSRRTSVCYLTARRLASMAHIWGTICRMEVATAIASIWCQLPVNPARLSYRIHDEVVSRLLLFLNTVAILVGK
ncbi:unnamed protein product [Polarella glacialis]|uniref:Uncharacterized protein n=1 Tax=Polarella glacialis TaxID=89957 RepID=A0A813H633_POLGL|nr:unnamed protein product [Polarella glacialis]